MPESKDIISKLLIGVLAAAIAYIASTAGGTPPVDIKLMIYLIMAALAMAIIWGIGVQQRFIETGSRIDDVDFRLATLMKSQQLLMRYRLLSDARDYIAQGAIAQEDLELWLEMYKSYERLGENGVLHEYHYKIVRLPVIYSKTSTRKAGQ